MDWIRRRLPNNVKQDPESVYTAAVAAAAFSIHSLEESDDLGYRNGKQKDELIKRRWSGELIKRSSFKKTNSDESFAKLPATPSRKTPERAYSARKLSHTFSNKLKNPDNVSEKDKRNGKLKSVLSWGNGKNGKISS